MQSTNLIEPFEHYEEKRAYPRLKVDCPVRLTTSDGQEISARIYDMSPDGLQIRCDRQSAAILNPGGRMINPESDSSRVKAIFTLTDREDDMEISVDGRLYYFVLIKNAGEQDVAFGLRFEEFEGHSVANFGRHLFNELETA